MKYIALGLLHLTRWIFIFAAMLTFFSPIIIVVWLDATTRDFLISIPIAFVIFTGFTVIIYLADHFIFKIKNPTFVSGSFP